MPIISLVVAVAQNRAIGKDNHLLCHLPEDMRHFREVTLDAVELRQHAVEAFQPGGGIGRRLPGLQALQAGRARLRKAGCAACSRAFPAEAGSLRLEMRTTKPVRSEKTNRNGRFRAAVSFL